MKKYEKKLKKYLLILLLFIGVIFTSSVLFVESSYFALKAKNYLSAYASAVLKKQITIKKIKFSIFSSQVKLYGLSIKNVAKIKRIDIRLGPIDFFKRKIIIDKINVINPNINILIKNNRVSNYKNINSIIKSLLREHFPIISVSFNKLKITKGNLNIDDADKNILLKLKKFDFTAFKSPTPVPFLYNSSGIYFKYKMPSIFLKSDELKLGVVFNSSAAEIHYFGGFVKYRKIKIANSNFAAVSSGILGLKKKINDTTIININNLSYFSKKFTAELPSLQGKSNIKLTVVGDFLGKIKANAKVYFSNVVFSGGDIKKGVIECGGNFGRTKNSVINFKSINLNLFGGTLESAGSINLKEKEGKFKSALKKINVGRLIEFYDTEKIPQFKALANGNVTTFLYLGKNFYVANIGKIKLNKPVQQLKFKNSKGAVSIYRINYKNRVLVKGETLINDKSVLLKNIHVTSRTLRGSVEGKINYAKKYLNIGFNSDYTELPAVDLIEEYRSRYFNPFASGVLKGKIKGKFHNISFNFRNRFKKLYINGYTGAYVGTADFDVAGDGKVLFKKVYLKEKNLRFNKRGTLTFSGEIFENKISKREYINGNFNTKNIHLISKKPQGPLSITFNSNGVISGELKNPVFKISAYSKKLEVDNQHISDVNFAFLLTKAELKIKKLEGFYSGETFNGYGSLRFGPFNSANSANSANSYGNYNYNNYNLRLISNHVNLANLDLKLLKKYHIKGTADINLHIGGSFNIPYVSGNASIRDIYINNYLLGNVSADAYSSGSNITLNLSALKNTFKAKATVLLKKGYPYNLNANINLFSIDYHNTLFRLSGGIFGSGKLSDIKNSYIFSKLDYMYLKHGPFFLKNTKSIKISYINRSLNLNGFELKGGNNYFQIKGTITPKKYNIVLNDGTDLWVLGIFSNKILNSSGFITASAVIFGPPTAPKLYGFANIRKGLIEPKLYSSFAASRIFAKLIFNNNIIFIKKSRFRMLNGIFSTHGIIRLNNFNPSYYNIITDFNSAIYRKLNYFYAKMDGKIRLYGNVGNPILYGNIDIKKALYDKKINLSSFLLNYKRYNIAQTEIIKKGVFNPKLNIRITSNKGIAIKNNIINTNFSTRLNLIGTVYNPILMGTANAEKGEMYFRGTMFKLSHVDLDFNNPYRINPSFDVAARTHINEYIIRMNTSGSLLDFNVNLSSTPPLSELDIVSMLALGAPTTSVYAGSAGGIAAAEAASAIGGGLEQSVTGVISSYFGFKNLSVAPSYSVVTHSAAPQVSITKSITKRLSVSYSNIVSSQSSQSVTITYGLSRHISLIGVWENNELAPNNSNIYSEVGGNIIFHFRFY